MGRTGAFSLLTWQQQTSVHFIQFVENIDTKTLICALIDDDTKEVTLSLFSRHELITFSFCFKNYNCPKRMSVIDLPRN